jgi:flagellar protein FlbD
LIELRRLNGKAFVLNCELIKTVEETPDTIVTLTTGEKMMVLEKVSEVVAKAAEFLKRIHSGTGRGSGD